MRRGRGLATAVLAAGALASIATSPAMWELMDSAPLPDTTLDPASPVVGYRVRAELRGPLEHTEGWLSVDLDGLLPATGEGPEAASALVTLTRESDPTDTVTEQLHAGPGAASFSASAALWTGCETPCVETFTLWIDRGEVTEPARPLVVAGTIAAHVDGVGGTAPAGVEIVVELEPIEAAP